MVVAENTMDQNMKNSRSLTKITKSLTVVCLVLAITLVAGFNSTALAQEKGATKLLQSKARSAPTNNTAAMICPKCKDTAVTVTEPPTKTGAKASTITVLRHECAECSQKLTTTGHGKSKAANVTHVCKAGGSESSSCCVLR